MEGTITRCSANYVPLSPIGFLERSSIVYSDRISIVYGDHVRYTWKETFDRCIRLASALTQLSISRGDVVATLAPNVPATYELHFGVPMAGGVLCVLNTQYDSEMVSMLLRQLEAKIIFVDYELLDIARDALEILSKTGSKPPLLIIIPKEDGDDHQTNLKYESLLAMGNSEFKIIRPKDECEPITISYTSGTTGTPKGVVYSHRGAYLNSLAFLLLKEMGSMPVYLWTVPMFHCNGWCMAWGVAAQGGTNICLRSISAKGVFDCIAQYKVTHMGGAPAVLNMIANTPASDRKPLHCKVSVMTGGAPPPPQVLIKMEELGFVVTHLYGMTESYGVGAVCTWKPEWSSLPPDERAKMKARQGVHHLVMQEIDVKDPITMKSVPHDAKTTGEVMFRGNTVMNGYLKNLDATQEAFKGGWYRTGDVGVRHPDGYVEIKDRLNDIIVLEGEGGKGENIVISTVEVESVLFSHPAILEAAVVGTPLVDGDKSSKASCAFVKLKDGCNATTAEEIIKFCIDRLPDYMAPKAVIFLEDLPKTSTGKTQKYVLKERAAKAM